MRVIITVDLCMFVAVHVLPYYHEQTPCHVVPASVSGHNPPGHNPQDKTLSDDGVGQNPRPRTLPP